MEGRRYGCNAVWGTVEGETYVPVCKASENEQDSQSIIGCSHADICIAGLREAAGMANVIVRSSKDSQRVTGHYVVQRNRQLLPADWTIAGIA